MVRHAGSSGLDFLKESVTARRTYDGSSCTSVTTFKESFPVPNSQELKCFQNGGSRRFVVPVTVRPAGPSQSSESRFSVPNLQNFLSVLKRDPATVRRAYDSPSWGPSPPPVFLEIKSAAQND